jgi:hypothetical protein
VLFYRCSDGHLFRLSLTRRIFSLHLGLKKYACCPVDGHWRIIRLVLRSQLTEAELAQMEGASR